ncbi:MAG: hypothetical protein K9L76_03330, partial [Candidatus Omnitrophica bacterium]|nr:hypothetical protein [Candidatus Omnitrophota bacterium]
MKTFSALVLEKDKAFLSFAILRGRCLQFLDEKKLLLISNDDFLKQLKANAKKIEKLIIDFEQEHS